MDSAIKLGAELSFLVFMLCALQSAISEESDCLAKRKAATNLASFCCSPTRPKFDPGYRDCEKEVMEKVPQTHKFSFADKLAIKMCIEECNYIGNGYSDASPPFALDFENIKSNLKKNLPQPNEDAVEFMLVAYKLCEMFRKQHPLQLDIRYSYPDFIDHACNPFALQITTCVRIYAMQECPAQLYDTSKQCTEARTFFKECVASVTLNVDSPPEG